MEVWNILHVPGSAGKVHLRPRSCSTGAPSIASVTVEQPGGGSKRARRAGDTSRRRWAARLAVALVLALGVAYLPYRLVGNRSGADLDRMRRELDLTQSEIERLRADNAERKRENESLKNEPAAIEEIARQELGLVRTGELVLRFERPETP